MTAVRTKGINSLDTLKTRTPKLPRKTIKSKLNKNISNNSPR